MNGLKLKINDMQRFYKIPANVEQIYQEESVRKNGITMKLLAIFIMLVEIFNISRVLFFTNAKLSTLNNQIYFTMYVLLFVSAVVFSLVDMQLKNKKTQRMQLHIIICYFWMLWHVTINCYDLSRTPDGDITVFSSAVLILAILAQIKPRHIFMIVTLSYMILLMFAGDAIDTGGYINATISFILASMISVRVYALAIGQIYQHVEIANQAKQLENERAQLKTTLEKYEMVLNNTNDYIFDIDFQKNQLVFTEGSRIAQHFGREISNVSQWLQTQTIIDSEYACSLIEAMHSFSATKREGDYTFPMYIKPDFEKWYRLRVFVTHSDDVMALSGIGIISDIDVQHRQVELLTSKAKTDPMTGLLNAMAFKESYTIALGNLGENECLVMLMIDLDNFKVINDTYGHFAGDCVLKEVAKILKTSFRDYDDAARLGGDEFAVIMKNVKDISAIKRKADKLADAISKVEITEHKIHITCSVGIAVAKDKAMPYDEIYKHADKLLYEAKSSGKDCCRISS